jgi:pimeloyl-ACP methyl ester carboxylesterase
MSKIANLLAAAETVGRPAVIALHCSGANGSEWQQLGGDLGHRFLLIAPNLIGNGGTEGWSGEHVFTLSDEAAKIVSITGSSEPMPLAAYRRFNFPVLLVQSEHTHQPMRMIARQLARAMRPASLQTIYGAGHMGPFSHAAAVSEMIAGHVDIAEARLPRSKREFRADISRAA